MRRSLSFVIVMSMLMSPAFAQAPLPVPPAAPPDAQGASLPAPPQMAQNYSPQELDRIVSPIALYPDPLLAQVLTAATFSPEIPDAARWADQHHYLPPPQLAAAIAADRLPWQPSIQALLPFPQVLAMMASDMPWTEEIGAAFLWSPQQVMDAVQRRRRMAYDYGYLRSNGQISVNQGPNIEIVPVDPAYIVVPSYNPAVVFAAPRPGLFIGGAIRFGYGIRLGVAFAPWGWGTTRFDWSGRMVIVNGTPWRRTWVNRAVYVHPFAAVTRYAAAPRVDERHVVHERSARERAADGEGRRRDEGHRR